MSRNELIALQKDCVHLSDQHDDRGFYGAIEVKRGLKRDSRRCRLPTRPTSPNTLEDQIKRTRAKLELPRDAGLHTSRQTFLTRAGKLTQNVKALQMLAGHSKYHDHDAIRPSGTGRRLRHRCSDVNQGNETWLASGLFRQKRACEGGRSRLKNDRPR